MANETLCILNRLYPDRSAREALDFLGVLIRNPHGFDLLAGYGTFAEYKDLTQLWIDAILIKRRDA